MGSAGPKGGQAKTLHPRDSRETPMDFFTVLNTRRSIRTFLPDPVSSEDRETLLRSACMAPSAMNKQPWEFVVVDRRDLLDAIAERHPYAKFAAQAPLAIVVCADPANASGEFWIQDCSAATENLLLAARALGLGAVWCGLYPKEDREQTVKDILGIPADRHALSLVILGHTDAQFTEARRWQPDKVHHNGW